MTLKPRYFVLTDISEEEPDDKQSLVRLLLYSCDIDIEGLVATTSQWKAVNKSGIRPDFIRDIINAYGQVETNLQKHRAGYPTTEYLHSLVASGNDNDMASVGDAMATEGSELLCQSILRDDPRPLWIGIWGGASTLAQALWSLRSRLSPEALDRCLSKVWIYEIQGQDDAGAWIAVTFPKLSFIRCQLAWRGMSYQVSSQWFESKGDYEDYVSPDWFREHIQEGHGPLGNAYPSAVYLHEGDTPSFLNLLPNGLNNPCQLDQGGWGGRYELEKRRNVWSGGCPVTDESRFGDFMMHSDAADRCRWQFWDNRPTCNPYNPIIRWRPAYQNDFAARMDWCLKDPGSANHPPQAVVNGDDSLDVLELAAKPGQVISLDASASSDPDGDSLTFQWWIYREPGTYRGDVSIRDAAKPVAQIHLPEDAAGTHIHVIVSVRDTGTPPLTAYRRVVIVCQ